MIILNCFFFVKIIIIMSFICHSSDDFSFVLNSENNIIENLETQDNEEKGTKDKGKYVNFPIYFYDEIKQDLNDNDVRGVLTRMLLASGLSELRSNSKTGRCNLTKLVLNDKNLHCVNILKQYKHINYIDMSSNHISDISFAFHIEKLRVLNVSHNEVDMLPVFKGGVCYLQLEILDLSFNRITVIPCNFSEQFQLLTRLNLSHNSITHMYGLQELQYLEMLNLSFNKLIKLDNISNLNIIELYVNNNDIRYHTEGVLSSNRRLTIIDISFNQLTSLKLFRSAFSLMQINISNNMIEDPMEILHLANLFKLRDLSLENNPLSRWCLYESFVLSATKCLIRFDSKLTQEIKSNAQFETRSNLWNEFVETHGRIISSMRVNDILVNKHFLSTAFPQRKHILVVLVGAVGSKMEELCQQVTRGNTEIYVPKKITTSAVRNKYLMNVSNQQFNILHTCGELIAAHEHYGISYGYSQTEISKCFKDDKICLTNMDLKAALSIKAFGYNPYLILVTTSNQKDYKDNLLSSFDFSIFKNVNSGKIQKKIISNQDNSRGINLARETDYRIYSNMSLENGSENEDDTFSFCSWHEYFRRAIVGEGTRSKIKSNVAEWELEIIDEIECLEEEDDKKEDWFTADDETKDQTTKKNTKRQELSLNRKIINDAKEMFLNDISQLLDSYEDFYNKHRELFYSNVNVRDILEAEEKLKRLLNTILKDHKEMNGKALDLITHDPLYETFIENIRRSMM